MQSMCATKSSFFGQRNNYSKFRSFKPINFSVQQKQNYVTLHPVAFFQSKEDIKSSVVEFSRNIGAAAVLVVLSAALVVEPAFARRKEGVNKPELLPDYFTRVIDVAGFLSAGQEQRLDKDLERLEADTGFKLRVLAQNYPETPGLAIKDYWGVDDNTIVFVADPSLSGNIINFNVGATVDLAVGRNFWSRVSGKYGNMFYWKEKGEDTAIEEAVIAIDTCLRQPEDYKICLNIFE